MSNDWYKNKGGIEYKRKYRQTQKYKTGHRKAFQKWYKTKGKQYQLKYEREYRKTAKGKQTRQKACQQWRKTRGKQYYQNAYKENPNQFKAYNAIRMAILSGNLISPKLLHCSYCGEKASLYHHTSYKPEQWLVVVPLCGLCHKEAHRKLSLLG